MFRDMKQFDLTLNYDYTDMVISHYSYSVYKGIIQDLNIFYDQDRETIKIVRYIELAGLIDIYKEIPIYIQDMLIVLFEEAIKNIERPTYIPRPLGSKEIEVKCAICGKVTSIYCDPEADEFDENSQRLWDIGWTPWVHLDSYDIGSACNECDKYLELDFGGLYAVVLSRLPKEPTSSNSLITYISGISTIE